MRITLNLPATTTFKERKGTWTLSTTPGFPSIGLLVITEKRSTRGKEYVRRYVLSEQEPSNGDRIFKVTKPMSSLTGDDSKDGPYFVGVPARGFLRCTCHGATKAKCVHIQCLEIIVASPEALHDYPSKNGGKEITRKELQDGTTN